VQLRHPEAFSMAKMLDVACWLADHGLGHHAETFARHGVSGDILPDLTDADLKELGLNLGDRKRLLKSIAALPAAVPAQDRAEAVARTAPRVEAREAERRQLTVMFVDLVGSTTLSARLDPEDMRDVIRAYQNAVAGEIARFEGHVAKFMGDGVLAYFGWPRAHEDEAERAVRAGLALVQTVAGLTTPAGEALAARIGIATGKVVVGDLIGEGATQEEAVVGETPNLAARLQRLAEPGSIAISQATRGLLGGLFELSDLGPQHLKGFAQPVGAWRVLGLASAESRFEAMHATGLTPLVGREHELGLLLERWSLARGGEGQVVLLSGEAGIGKSRISRALLERLGDETYTRLRYYCSPYHTNSALHPVIEQLERAAGLTADDSADFKLDKLEAVLGQAIGRVTEVAPLLAALLSIPSEGRYPPHNLTPAVQKMRTLDALVGQLEGLAAQQPVLMVFEDAHWIDPTTIELFELVIERVQHLPVLLLITFRPEFNSPWAGHAHTTSLALNRLGRNQGAAMVAGLIGGRPLPAEVMEQILAKTDGVPLFVEELTKTVLESGLLADAGDHYELAGPLPPLAIPTTLQDSLMARLDRLAPVKEVAQIGAVIGREFSYELLAAVATMSSNQLSDALEQLVNSELVFRRGHPPQANYTFKHALVQEVAYQSLLKSKRQELHARTTRVLEERFPEVAEVQPELLAHHCTQAGLIEQALAYGHQAGLRAMARSAYREAVAQLKQGLDLVPSLPDGPERRRRELDLQVALGGARIAATGWAAPETGATYARARELCHEVGDTPQLVPTLWGLFQFHANRAELRKGWEIAEEFLRVAEQRKQDTAARVISHRVAGISSQYLGQLARGFSHHEQALACYDPRERSSPVFFAAVDTRVHSLGWTAWVLLHQGFPDQGLRRIREALTLADELVHPYSSAYALHLTCGFHQFRRDQQIVAEKSSMQMSVAAEQGFPHWLATATIFHGWAVATGGELEAGIAEMHRGLAALQAAGGQLNVPYYLGLLAGAYTRAAQAPKALQLLAEALARVEETEECWYEAELHRLRAKALLGTGLTEANEAEASFRQAIDVARVQGVKFWEIRASTNLARMWAAQGKRDQARDLLAPIYGWFTEGFDTADLTNARALLEELR
jgi:predicted ATPase/class 3 adenylate cyclase